MNSISTLESIRQKLQRDMKLREKNDIAYKIEVIMGERGYAAGAREIVKTVSKYINDKQLDDVLLLQVDADDYVEENLPVLYINQSGKDKKRYENVSIDQVESILDSCFINKSGTSQGNLKDMTRSAIMVCGVAGCESVGSKKLVSELEKQLRYQHLENEVDIIHTGCFGLCVKGPIILIHPEGSFYTEVKKDDIERIVEQHLLKGKIVKDLIYEDTLTEDQKIIPFEQTKFYKKQKRIALRNCGLINPENIQEYLAVNGYKALEKCLKEMTSEEVLQVMEAANLRGRGGGGFPCGRKMRATARQAEPIKYVCVNADEGDPGAFMDRSLLEGDPHSIIEAMAITGYAIGSNLGFVYVRAEYPVAVERLRNAVEQAHKLGILGDNILGSNFAFDVDIRLGSGAFVCGEGTALSNSIEGKRGEPRKRPPRLAEVGIFGKPTMLSNVETYSNIPPIILNGAEWFKSIGTQEAPGTKVFALGGKIENTGLVEVPMGVTLREIIEEIGGGIPNGKKIKAAQTGGPSGGCITEKNLDTPVGFDSLSAIGSMMGSGGLIVMDEDTCMVDIAKFYLDFTVDESCGKCTPCRIGTKRMHEILVRITEGMGKSGDIEQLEELSEYIINNSLCGLGQSAPLPVLSTLKHFRHEYEMHINDKICPAHSCKALYRFDIIEEKCIGCSKCARNCPVAAISGKPKSPYKINQDECIKCGICVDNCNFNAIKKS